MPASSILSRLSFFLFLLSTSLPFCRADDGLLANWMGKLQPLIGEQTILDLSLPGTHDSLTYNLSTIVSVGGFDGSYNISELLHLASELGIAPGPWIRKQSKTQGLTLTEQLDNGIRFIDFRTMFSNVGGQQHGWYSLHFVQSAMPALFYLQELRAWLDAHPTEIVVLWMSKHGSPCATGDDQYTKVSTADKRLFWSQIETLFYPLLVNTQESPVNETSINTLLNRNQRLLVYAADWVDFSGSSVFAMDACNIDNELVGGVDQEQVAFNDQLVLFSRAAQLRAQDKAANKFFLTSLATSAGEKELLYSFLVKFVPLDVQKNRMLCAQQFALPNITDWCPETLQDISQLANFYSQLILDTAFNRGWEFPNAIYIDAVDQDGTIRTGTAVFGPNMASPLLRDYEAARYAYADTLLLVNVQRVCKGQSNPLCNSWFTELAQRRSRYPLLRWDDFQHGRHSDWPEVQ